MFLTEEAQAKITELENDGYFLMLTNSRMTDARGNTVTPLHEKWWVALFGVEGPVYQAEDAGMHPSATRAVLIAAQKARERESKKEKVGIWE